MSEEITDEELVRAYSNYEKATEAYYEALQKRFPRGSEIETVLGRSGKGKLVLRVRKPSSGFLVQCIDLQDDVQTYEAEFVNDLLNKIEELDEEDEE